MSEGEDRLQVVSRVHGDRDQVDRSRVQGLDVKMVSETVVAGRLRGVMGQVLVGLSNNPGVLSRNRKLACTVIEITAPAGVTSYGGSRMRSGKPLSSKDGSASDVCSQDTSPGPARIASRVTCAGPDIQLFCTGPQTLQPLPIQMPLRQLRRLLAPEWG